MQLLVLRLRLLREPGLGLLQLVEFGDIGENRNHRATGMVRFRVRPGETRCADGQQLVCAANLDFHQLLPHAIGIVDRVDHRLREGIEPGIHQQRLGEGSVPHIVIVELQNARRRVVPGDDGAVAVDGHDAIDHAVENLLVDGQVLFVHSV